MGFFRPCNSYQPYCAPRRVYCQPCQSQQYNAGGYTTVNYTRSASTTSANVRQPQVNQASTNGRQQQVNLPSAKQLYKSNNPYATIARCFTGDYNKLYSQCVSEGGQKGASTGATIGSTTHPGIFNRAATRIGSNKGYQQGVQQGAQTARQVEGSLRKFESATPENAQDAIKEFQQNLKNIESNMQAQINNTYAQYGLRAPANAGSSSLGQSINQIGELSKIPLPVANELVNMTPEKIKSTLTQLQQAGDSYIKQATVLARNCPNAIGAMVDEALKVSLNSANNASNSSSNVDNDMDKKAKEKIFREDLEKNGPELLKAIAELPDETKKNIEDSLLKSFSSNFDAAMKENVDIEKVLSPENLKLANGIMQNNQEAVSKLMQEAVKVIQRATREGKLTGTDVTMDKLLKLGRIYDNLKQSNILDTLKNADKDTYEELVTALSPFSRNSEPSDDDAEDCDSVFIEG